MMSDYFHQFASASGFGTAKLRVRFDAEVETPALITALSLQCPRIPDIMRSLRSAIPLVPHSGVGPVGHFFRIPNHYRSVSFLVPAESSTTQADDESEPVAGAIVFKGTEPLLSDFSDYLDWMLSAPFRSSSLPLALHFALDMKLPPAAMWIEECINEQRTSSLFQTEYLNHYGRLARVPVPLFVYQLADDQVDGYERELRRKLSPAAMTRIQAKVADGLGVEVYYYPMLPVRAADLVFKDIKEAFIPSLDPQALESIFSGWVELLADMLHLGYMPYVEWNHGMGGCVDSGNACIDGGFTDLLTLVPFSSIPNEDQFRRALWSTMQLLASSVVGVCSVATGTQPGVQPDSTGMAFAYIAERLRVRVQSEACSLHHDPRLSRCFSTPQIPDVLRHLRELHRDGQNHRQFVSPFGSAVPREGSESTLAGDSLASA